MNQISKKTIDVNIFDNEISNTMWSTINFNLDNPICGIMESENEKLLYKYDSVGLWVNCILGLYDIKNIDIEI
ncbi:hypothetical protein [Paramaledivibacter caminithermalis]|jgi:hypothetical protein|uniref:Uncharacterized protein n=1 Tax=Paramaledivibacter caminithermalis (strain DSM 15212 / CIP 107654 / DViRD3) TaxID=1121301 RepID=A0A1M6RXL6_PARC5|nr:hypothetical protein [Paramaledivibacter caminithermalis]SHK37252.1 hypothetical protein SAMN02745912_03115 [Paramaledivibacter caminithermalis DSM 15212]